MAKIIKMMDLLKKEGIELGKVYTAKDKPPFKVERKLTEKINQSKVNSSFTRVIAFVRKEAKKLNDDDLYAMTQKLAKWFK